MNESGFGSNILDSIMKIFKQVASYLRKILTFNRYSEANQ